MRRQLICVVAALLVLAAGKPAGKAYIPFAETKPLLARMAETLPSELRGKPEIELARNWPAFAQQRDHDIRERLAKGDEDSLANLLLFGTSFTAQPRITPEYVARVNAGQASPKAFDRRIDDLLRALATPGGNDRLQFMRNLIVRKGMGFATPAARLKVSQYLAANLQRVLDEHQKYGAELAAARQSGDTGSELIERSRLFRERGVSLDTTLWPNYALEESLRQMKSRDLVKSGSIRRVAIVGPGLEFVDKQEGYDFYPQQTIQPFAVIDSLLRLGLADAKQLQVVTLDISARVNQHIAAARVRAAAGKPYALQLPHDPAVAWNPGAIEYWKRFGDQIGSETKAVSPPSELKELKVRAVAVRPEFVRRVRPEDLNVVWQRLLLPEDEKFDLIIGTNIFVYYDAFEQALAMKNMEHMLRKGGWVLSNNLLIEVPETAVHAVDSATVEFSGRQADGDHIVWYRRD